MGDGNKLSNIFNLELLDQVPPMGINGQGAEKEFICDNLACFSLCEEAQDLFFSPGELWRTPQFIFGWAADDLHDFTAIADISLYRFGNTFPEFIQ